MRHAMILRISSLWLVITILAIGCTQDQPKPAKPIKQAIFDKDAADRFLNFVKMGSDLKVDGKEVVKAFNDCFAEGLPLSAIVTATIGCQAPLMFPHATLKC